MEILLQLDAERHVGVANWVGADVPLHASSAGKLILSDLDPEGLDAWLAVEPLEAYTRRTITDPDTLRAEVTRAGRQGWAELADELEIGLASISVPVSGPNGSLVGVIGVSGPTFRLGKPRRLGLLPRVRTAAATIERTLASRLTTPPADR
jgi:DNA-binding IclR family transcriptional regulator